MPSVIHYFSSGYCFRYLIHWPFVRRLVSHFFLPAGASMSLKNCDANYRYHRMQSLSHNELSTGEMEKMTESGRMLSQKSLRVNLFSNMNCTTADRISS